MVYRKAEHWAGRTAVILAVAGSAIGLGTFLRFPTQAILYDGSAFMFAYLCALLVLGVPIVWMEWALGRLGGIWGRHSLPGIYDQVTQRSWGKYLGVLALYLPFVIVAYYLYIESWALGYTFISALRLSPPLSEGAETAALFTQYLGADRGPFALPVIGLLFLAATLAINFYVVFRGVEAGIEKLNLVAMPLLFAISAFLMVYMLMQPGTAQALEFLWSPRIGIRTLANPDLWLAATGQVLFTLSLGVGAIITYASYLRKDDDVALAGLTPVAMSQFAAIILAATIIVPAAWLYLGGDAVKHYAELGPFTLPFIVMPLLFQQLPMGHVIGALWFLLIFFAGVTASVSLLQPILAFFQDELGWSRRAGTMALLGLTAALLAPVVLLQHRGFLHQLDFWSVHILLPLGVLIEVIVFVTVLGMSRGWEGITFRARIRVPRVYRYILMVVTPLALLAMLGYWFWQEAVPTMGLEYVTANEQPVIIAARVTLGALLLAMLLVLRFAWKRRLEAAPAEEIPHTEDSVHVP